MVIDRLLSCNVVMAALLWAVPARAQAIPCDGAADARPAINAAIEAAAQGPAGGVVTLPPGICRVDTAAGHVMPRSGVTLRGQGRGRTVILADDARGIGGTGGGGAAITNAVRPGTPGAVAVPTGGVFAPLADFHLRELTVKGLADGAADPPGAPPRAHLVNLVSVADVTVRDCEFLSSRFISLAISHGRGVSVQDNRVDRSARDSIALWDVSDAIVTGNHVTFSGDDSISAQSSDAAAGPVRSGLIISHNSISDGPGISVLGAREAIISDNVLRRIPVHGIEVGASPAHRQGGVALMAVSITGNVITDVFDWSGWRPGHAKDYIRIDAKPRGGGPANAWVRVENNTLVRTLPAVAAWSDWGFGAALRTHGGGSYNGPVTEAMLGATGIHVEGGLTQSRIAGNLIRTGGAHAIAFSGAAELDYDGLVIAGNQMAGFKEAGILLPMTGQQRIRIERNEFDAEPTDPPPRAIAGAGGAAITDNRFRNVAP